jgi:hypothetical protein
MINFMKVCKENEMHYDILIVVTPADSERLLPLYPRLAGNFDNGNICFIGTKKVGELVENSAISDRSSWVDENDIVPFDEVHACMAKRLAPILKGDALPRGVTGWYYQQFLKMQYAAMCKDEYYMVWDGDTIPCRKINMFSPETRQPYLDLKHEHHAEYFETMGKILPGFGKVIERSFISEHMLFRCDIMKNLIADIEKNDWIEGKRFWEKIINAIEPEKIYDSSFSEFETYGTYVALRYNEVYRLREWHSFRLGGSFYEIDTITDGDFAWLGVDFDAISFEKGQTVLEENKGYFDNPEVQKKISAKKLLQAAQMEYRDAYKEVWADDPEAVSANVRKGGYWQNQNGAADDAESAGSTGVNTDAAENGRKTDAGTGSSEISGIYEDTSDRLPEAECETGQEDMAAIGDDILSKIPYSAEDEFTVLHYGCGNGAVLRGLKNLFPGSTLYGIEADESRLEAAKKTGKVFESIDEVLDYFDDPFANVLLVESDTWNALADEEKEILKALLLPGAKVIYI